MNILYLHGLMSSNISSKTDWLQENYKVFNPFLNYKGSSETIFNSLELLCEQNKFHLIIGSSMGAYLAYHISNKFNIPSLLFNPSLEKNSITKPKINEVENLKIKHTIILGKNDNVVIPVDTLNFLKDRKVNFTYTFEPNGHRTPLEVFQKHFSKIVDSL
ncbi:YqiA/YcfP family alpha/beta fold hydrolase [Winogradskyella litorisediminis]|uniref:YqiA/YcfP family alpha/beta fold hydrolase n=1 Tax=Winogradskyella litorisediminis TaxID=1156618 RepID=A0ABW3NCS3_9FLAO